MRIWMELIKSGIEFYTCIALFALPMMVLASFGRDKKISLTRVCIDQLFLLYSCCLMAIVFLPTKDSAIVPKMGEIYVQFVPFHWVVELLEDASVSVISGVVLNILLTVPFGAYLKYTRKWNTKKIVAVTFLLSVCIEMLQLSGLFGTFSVSYRVTDVDDLMTNTLGGFVGCVCANKLAAFTESLAKLHMAKAVAFK